MSQARIRGLRLAGALAFLALLALPAAVRAQAGDLAAFRLHEKGNPHTVTLSETSRQGRKSFFTASQPMSTDVRALFAMCSFAELTEKRGFSHLAIIQNSPSQFILGMFNEHTDQLGAVFGADLDHERVLGKTTGAVARALAVCPKIPSAGK